MATPGAPIVNVYYGRPMLPDVSRVLACLYEKDVEFKLVDMYEGKCMPADLLKLQASTRVPVPSFEDGPTFLSESRAICRYVSGKYVDRGNKYLLGRDMLERASIEQWLKSEEQSFDPPSRAMVFHLAFATPTSLTEPDRVLITQNEQRLAKVLDVYEQRLSKSTYLAGHEFTLADLSHLPNSHYLADSSEWAYLFEKRKNVQRWWELVSRRPSWTKVVEILNEVEILKGPIHAEDSPTSQQSLPQVMRSMSSATKPLMIRQTIPTAMSSSVQMNPPSGPSQHAGPQSVIAKSYKQSSSTAQPNQNPNSAESSLQEPLNKAAQTSSKPQLEDQVTHTTPREPPAATPISTQQDATKKLITSKPAEPDQVIHTAPHDPPAATPTSTQQDAPTSSQQQTTLPSQSAITSQATEQTPSTDQLTNQPPQKAPFQMRELSSTTQSTSQTTRETTQTTKKQAQRIPAQSTYEASPAAQWPNKEVSDSEHRTTSSTSELSTEQVRQSVSGAHSTEVASLNDNPSTQPAPNSQTLKEYPPTEKPTQKGREATVQYLEADSSTTKPITETSTASQTATRMPSTDQTLIQPAQTPVHYIKPDSPAQLDTGKVTSSQTILQKSPTEETTTQPAELASSAAPLATGETTSQGGQELPTVQSTIPESLNSKLHSEEQSASQASKQPLPAQQVQKDASQQIQETTSTSEQTTGTAAATQTPTKQASRDIAQSREPASTPLRADQTTTRPAQTVISARSIKPDDETTSQIGQNMSSAQPKQPAFPVTQSTSKASTTLLRSTTSSSTDQIFAQTAQNKRYVQSTEPASSFTQSTTQSFTPYQETNPSMPTDQTTPQEENKAPPTKPIKLGETQESNQAVSNSQTTTKPSSSATESTTISLDTTRPDSSPLSSNQIDASLDSTPSLSIDETTSQIGQTMPSTQPEQPAYQTTQSAIEASTTSMRNTASSTIDKTTPQPAKNIISSQSTKSASSLTQSPIQSSSAYMERNMSMPTDQIPPQEAKIVVPIQPTKLGETLGGNQEVLNSQTTTKAISSATESTTMSSTTSLDTTRLDSAPLSSNQIDASLYSIPSLPIDETTSQIAQTMPSAQPEQPATTQSAVKASTALKRNAASSSIDMTTVEPAQNIISDQITSQEAKIVAPTQPTKLAETLEGNQEVLNSQTTTKASSSATESTTMSSTTSLDTTKPHSAPLSSSQIDASLYSTPSLPIDETTSQLAQTMPSAQPKQPATTQSTVEASTRNATSSSIDMTTVEPVQSIISGQSTKSTSSLTQSMTQLSTAFIEKIMSMPTDQITSQEAKIVAPTQPTKLAETLEGNQEVLNSQTTTKASSSATESTTMSSTTSLDTTKPHSAPLSSSQIDASLYSTPSLPIDETTSQIAQTMPSAQPKQPATTQSAVEASTRNATSSSIDMTIVEPVQSIISDQITSQEAKIVAPTQPTKLAETLEGNQEVLNSQTTTKASSSATESTTMPSTTSLDTTKPYSAPLSSSQIDASLYSTPLLPIDETTSQIGQTIPSAQPKQPATTQLAVEASTALVRNVASSSIDMTTTESAQNIISNQSTKSTSSLTQSPTQSSTTYMERNMSMPTDQITSQEAKIVAPTQPTKLGETLEGNQEVLNSLTTTKAISSATESTTMSSTTSLDTTKPHSAPLSSSQIDASLYSTPSLPIDETTSQIGQTMPSAQPEQPQLTQSVVEASTASVHNTASSSIDMTTVEPAQNIISDQITSQEAKIVAPTQPTKLGETLEGNQKVLDSQTTTKASSSATESTTMSSTTSLDTTKPDSAPLSSSQINASLYSNPSLPIDETTSQIDHILPSAQPEQPASKTNQSIVKASTTSMSSTPSSSIDMTTIEPAQNIISRQSTKSTSSLTQSPTQSSTAYMERNMLMPTDQITSQEAKIVAPTQPTKLGETLEGNQKVLNSQTTTEPSSSASESTTISSTTSLDTTRPDLSLLPAGQTTTFQAGKVTTSAQQDNQPASNSKITTGPTYSATQSTDESSTASLASTQSMTTDQTTSEATKTELEKAQQSNQVSSNFRTAIRSQPSDQPNTGSAQDSTTSGSTQPPNNRNPTT